MKYFLIILTLLIQSVWADSHALFNYNNREYIERQDTSSIRSIASITKLFTAITILKDSQDLDSLIEVDCKNKGRVGVGMQLSRRDLLTATVVSSDNCAAETLANNYSGGYSKFISDREVLIRELGLFNTHLHDPTGLSVFNVSTVEDLIVFAPIAYQNEVLRSIANLPEARLTAYRKGRKIVVPIRNTNPSLYIHPEIVVSKTGFTNAAGRCVIILTKRLENLYAVVVLGEPNLKSRTRKVEKLLAYNETTAR